MRIGTANLITESLRRHSTACLQIFKLSKVGSPEKTKVRLGSMKLVSVSCGQTSFTHPVFADHVFQARRPPSKFYCTAGPTFDTCPMLADVVACRALKTNWNDSGRYRQSFFPMIERP